MSSNISEFTNAADCNVGNWFDAKQEALLDLIDNTKEYDLDACSIRVPVSALLDITELRCQSLVLGDRK